MNRRGLAVSTLICYFVVGVVLSCFASKRHAEQRIEKQKTEEGRIEYPPEFQ